MDYLNLLPVEIWRQIFRAAVEPIPKFARVLEIDPLIAFRARQPWPEKLLTSSLEMRLALCRVCKPIKPLAEELLYELLVLRHYDSLEGAIQALAGANHGGSPQGRGSLVHTIFLLDFERSTPAIPDTERLLTRLFGLCPNLSACTFSGLDGAIPAAWINTLSILPSTVRSLCWTDAEFFMVNIIEDMPCLAQLQHLSFTLALHTGISAAPLRLPNLKSLTLPTSVVLGQAVEQWELPSLVWVDVVVESVDGLEMLSPFFQRYGRTLEFLQLAASSINVAIPPSIFDHCTNLKTLSFDLLSFSMFDSTSTPGVIHDKLHTLVISMDEKNIYEGVAGVYQSESMEKTMQYFERGLKGLEEVHLIFSGNMHREFASMISRIVSVTFPTCRVVILDNPMLSG
jgi:hypothetical protein